MDNSPQFIEPPGKSQETHLWFVIGLMVLIVAVVVVIILFINHIASPVPALPTIAVLATDTPSTAPATTIVLANAISTNTAATSTLFLSTATITEPTLAIPTKTQTRIAGEATLTQSTTLSTAVTLPTSTLSEAPLTKIIPDSELVYSPAASGFNLAAFLQANLVRNDSYFASYIETVSGRQMTAADSLDFVSTNTSVNPRLLLALLEYKSGWLSSSQPQETTYPFGYRVKEQAGFFNQLIWAANELNDGYYGAKTRGIDKFTFADKSILPHDPAMNFGTVGLAQFFARTDKTRSQWQHDISEAGFLATYHALFSDPFSRAVEPLIPPDLQQPEFTLPFPQGQTWYFSAGPHGGWGRITSGWAAIDFAPPYPPDFSLETDGRCYISPYFVTSISSGKVVRSADGAVVVDIDMDGDEHTGWTVLYLHLADQDRVPVGTVVSSGTLLGHPSCQGFMLNSPGTHLHIARRFNGEWIPADCPLCAATVSLPPFVLSGWRVKGDPRYASNGWLVNGTQVRRLMNGRDDTVNGVSW